MQSLFTELMYSSNGSFFLGFSLALGFVSSAMSCFFYVKFRQEILKYFAIMNIALFVVLGSLNQDPRYVYDLESYPIGTRLVHLLTGICLYYSYKLSLAIFTPLPKIVFFNEKRFKFFVFLCLLFRLIVVIYPNAYSIRFAAFLTFILLLLTFIYSAKYQSKFRSTLNLKIGSMLFSGCLMVYPLIRATSPEGFYLSGTLGLFVFCSLGLFSIFWLLALVEMYHEKIEGYKVSHYRDLATNFLQIRNLMNSPLQVIDFATTLIKERPENTHQYIGKIQNAIQELHEINDTLKSYEKNVDWESKQKPTDNFFGAKSKNQVE